MDLFEYILIMTSVIFAMAAGQLLLGLGRWAQSTARVRTYMPHSVWVAIVFLMIFANWWANWEFRSIVWTLPKYTYMVVSPTVLFFACGLLMPQSFEQEEVDLEEHFLRVWRPPGPPILGSARAMASDPLGFLLEQHRHLGPIFRVRAGHMKLVVMAGERANAFAHGEGADCLSNRETWAPDSP